METIFTNTGKIKTSEPHRFKLDLTDKLNLKYPNKNMAFFVFITRGKTSSHNTTTINLKFQQQLGTILFIYLMILILLLRFNIFLNLSSKNTKH